MILVKLTPSDLKVVLRDVGSVVMVVGYTLFLPLMVALFSLEEEMYYGYLYPALAAVWAGFLLKKIFHGAEETRLKHAMITGGLSWLVVSLIGAVPFLTFGFGFIDAYFESMSGFTTTGMTVIPNVEALPSSLLFWRSLTQWIGGVGVIMLFLLVLVESGTTVARFYSAEARAERIAPGIPKTITYIWRIYVLYTILGATLYYLAGMSALDAMAHAFSAIATGGYSTKNLSIAAFDSIAIEAITVLLMLLGSISFVVHYRILTGNRREALNNPELKAFAGIIFVAIFAVFVDMAVVKGYDPLPAMRQTVFQVVAIITTAGFSTMDVYALPDFSKTVVMFLMVAGGCMGSTAGGFKILRVIILLKEAYNEMLKTILPERAILHLRVGDKIIESEEILKITGIFFLFVTFLFGGGLAFTVLGYDPFGAMSLSFSALSNVGPVFISSSEWFSLPDVAKVILIVEMWIGRLEIFPALALLGSIIITLRREKPYTR